MLSAFALFAGVAIIGGWLVLTKDWRDSARFSAKPAFIRKTRIEAGRGSLPERMRFDVEGYYFRIAYAYQVEGQTYLGKRFSAMREPFFLSEADAEAFAALYPEESAITIRVDPENPARTLVERQLIFADKLPLYAGLAALALGALTF
ncbi:MAG: DUF3592 domain-containing protein [Hyphomicrobiaceae bacterium]|nr:DUF3592 domain-containing protein [Hyphomicrobiaceae bacterium]